MESSIDEHPVHRSFFLSALFMRPFSNLIYERLFVNIVSNEMKSYTLNRLSINMCLCVGLLERKYVIPLLKILQGKSIRLFWN